MIAVLGTFFAAMVGLAFGSFLNVCLTRLPAGESVIRPPSRCLQCGRALSWWENVPVLSWLALRGRCRSCRIRIPTRYLLVELTVGLLWAAVAWQAAGQVWPPFQSTAFDGSLLPQPIPPGLVFSVLGKLVFTWLLVGLAVLDAEHFWLPDFVTLPAIVLGGAFTVWRGHSLLDAAHPPGSLLLRLLDLAFALLISAGLILSIRWLYWLVRRREGIGLGDAKLMAMLAAWLGLSGALLAFSIGAVLGAAVGLVLLFAPPAVDRENPGLTRLPLGTFLCLGGLISAFYGTWILNAYLHWAGFS
jgi:leader peptidase (prepilin peptidase) / N-methyltransferase